MKKGLYLAMTVVIFGAVTWLITRPGETIRTGFAHYAIDSLEEPSGLTGSGKNTGVYWTHNDSGNDPILYATTADGRLLGTWDVQGVEAVDWEAITTDRRGHLYLGDFGNNANRRRDLTVYRIPEPLLEPNPANPMRGRLSADRTIRFHYAEQKKFPDLEYKNFDAEALFWAEHPKTGTGTLYLLTKHRTDTLTSLYRFEHLRGSESRPLTLIGRVDLGGGRRRQGSVTGAAIHRRGKYLAVLTYYAIFIFKRPRRGDNFLSQLVNRIQLNTALAKQAEAIAWDGDALIFTNEQGDLYRIGSPLEIRQAPTASPP